MPSTFSKRGRQWADNSLLRVLAAQRPMRSATWKTALKRKPPTPGASDWRFTHYSSVTSRFYIVGELLVA